MIRRKFDGKTIGALLLAFMTVCLSAFAATQKADAWTLNPSDFRYDMVLYFSISDQGYDNLDQFEVGAFIDDECRGLAETVKLPDGEEGLYLRIRSNSTAPQEVKILMRNKQTGKIYHLSPENGESIVFKSNEVIGLPSEPCELSVYFDVKVTAGENGRVDFTNGLYAGGTQIKIVAIADEGYHFDSWSDGNKDADRTLTVTGDLDLTANFTPDGYTVEFKIGDEIIDTKTFLYGENVVAPEAPVKDGYTFTGWENLPATMPAKNLVIIGNYVLNTYKVVFRIDDLDIEVKELAFGAEISAPEAPAKEGYTFAGWANIPTMMPAESIIITGSYLLNNYKLTFFVGDEILETKDVPYGSEVIVPSAPEIEGYTFSGWDKVPATMPATDLEFKGGYNLNSYKLTFVIDNVVIEEKELTYGAEIVAPAVADKEGYNFMGWLNLTETMPASDLIILGTYEKNNHLLTFMIDDRIFEERIVAYGDAIAAPSAPAKEGYTFSGWGDVPATMPAKDLVISANYNVNSYKLTFTIDGEVVETTEMAYGSIINVPPTPEKDGYTFSGWSDVPATMPAKDLVISANYNVNSYKLTFIIDDVVIEEKEIAYGSEIVAPATPDKEGHKFIGWFNFVPTMPAADLIISGTYEKNSHLLSFVIDGQVIEERVLPYGSEITVPEAPIKEGYSFLGWEQIPTSMPAKDLVINGSYSLNSYKITFYVDDKMLEEKWVAFGSEITAPEAAPKEGYSFSGWGGIPSTMPATDLEFKGSYTINIYKLTFIIDDVVVEEKQLTFGSEIVAPATPDKEGHKFIGWFNFVSTMPAADLIISGTYEKNSHLLSFVIDGQVVEERVLPYGSEITVPEAPVKLGHTFAGWDNLPSVMPAKDLVVTGSYLVNTYTVTFTIDDVLVKTEELPYGAEIVVPEAPEKEGYTFVGWGDVPTTMPAWNLDFKAAYMTTLYKLTFIIDDVVVEEKQLTFGSEIVAPATPDKDGQQFVGWFNFVSTMPAADLTIYGTYEKNNHLLTFMIDGQVIAEKVLASGSEITVPEAPEKEGYTFAGWDNVPSVMPAKDLVINGSYIANLYKLTFSVNGEIIESIELPYGSPITVPAAPEIEGCTFLGWGNVPATMPAFDLTFTGMYSAKTYRLLVYVNEEVYMDEMIPYGTVVMVKDPVAPENMKFEGWSETIPTTMPAHDVTIYGKMVEDGQSSVIGTLVNANDNVTIYNLNGVMLYKDVKANEIKERLTPGIYIINGKKVIIR